MDAPPDPKKIRPSAYDRKTIVVGCIMYKVPQGRSAHTVQPQNLRGSIEILQIPGSLNWLNFLLNQRVCKTLDICYW